MRAGGFTIQQALSSEAANIIKQAITLAHRRGHAQVTPLHVANTMLSSATGHLRLACVRSQSNSHPLQCKALELCFNVALNRLPTSSSIPMQTPNHLSQHPFISNALVAAFKRAQAHQRRGSIENQQQLMAVKIELEQLIISILDDPSVSRVMREAGFSSTQVKTNIEQLVSLELSSQTQATQPPTSSKECTKQNSIDNRLQNQIMVMNEDVVRVIENLINAKRSQSLVVVGESVSSIEGVVGKVMEKVDKNEVPESLQGVKFISLSLLSFGQLSRDDVEKKLGELRSLIKGFVQRGVVLYLGDLKWITEFRINSWGHGRGFYCPIEHLIIELGRLVCDINDDAKVRVMAISSFQTFMRCKSGNPSLQAIWKLHPLTILAGSLSLSLVPQRYNRLLGQVNESLNQYMDFPFRTLIHSPRKLMHYCNPFNHKYSYDVHFNDIQSECGTQNDYDAVRHMICESGEIESEAKSLTSSSLIPTWLSDKKVVVNGKDQECVSVKDLCKKWNSICTSQASSFSYNQENPNSTPNSVSSSDLMEVEYVQKFREFNGKNLKDLCNALEEKVPWQKDIVPDIAGTILKCRSRMLRRKEIKNDDEPKEETWFLFQGTNARVKEKIARELAKIVFGSYSNFTTISLSNFSKSPRADITDEMRNKRSRDEQSCSYLEKFAEAVSINPHRVFLVEDAEQVDYCSLKGIKLAMERGKLTCHSNGEEICFQDAIIVLSCESLRSRSRTCSPLVKKNVEKENENEESAGVYLDLNIAFDEDDEEQPMFMDDIGLLESVDKCINFNIQDLSL